MAKKFTFRGMTVEQLQELSHEEFSKLVNARQRRSIKRGFSKPQKKLLQRIKAAKVRGGDKMVRTQERNMIVLPEMIGAKLGVYTGQEYKIVVVDESMVGHLLGEFAMTRKQVKHSSPGFGATRSSKYIPLK